MCVNCNDSLQVNLPVAPSGINGTNGQSAYVYIASANSSTGAGFSYPQNPAQSYIAILNTTTPINNPAVGDFTGLWHLWTGPTGPTGGPGPIGPQGPLGPYGGVTFEYSFSSFSALAADPGATKLGVVAAGNPLFATQIVINHQPLSGGNIGQYFSYIEQNNFSAFKASIKISKKSDPSAFYVFRIVNVTVAASYTTFDLLTVPPTNPVLGFGLNPINSNDDILISFEVRGDQGDYITTATEAPGANCALGGLKVEVRNGSTNAVVSTTYVCRQDNIAPGIINWYASGVPPAGYLVCNGAEHAIASYPNLAAVLGVGGSGNPWDTFNGALAPASGNFRVPDLRGLFIRGASPGTVNTFDPASSPGGRDVALLQLHSLQTHRHIVSGIDGSYYQADGGNGNDVANAGPSGNGTVNTSTPNTGGLSPDNARLSTETRPVNVSLLPCIKF